MMVLSLFRICLTGNCFAENNYLYKSICPGGDRYFDGVDAKVCTKDGCYYKDRWGFAQCNCTSYAASALNEYGIAFDNHYRQTGNNAWHNGGDWDNAALRAGIKKDTFPIPGDIVYWERDWTNNPKIHYDDVGHVAEVAIVEYNSEMTDWNRVFIKQYNGDKKYGYSEKWITHSNNPSGFIHILAYEEGINSLFYLNCLEQNNLCQTQTKEEWQMIVHKVWNNYRCSENVCYSKYNSNWIVAIANSMIGLGGGPGYQTTPNQEEEEVPATLPDFVVKKVILTATNGNEKYQFHKNEEIKIKALLKNIGDDGIEIRYYLSRGSKEY